MRLQLFSLLNIRLHFQLKARTDMILKLIFAQSNLSTGKGGSFTTPAPKGTGQHKLLQCFAAARMRPDLFALIVLA